MLDQCLAEVVHPGADRLFDPLLDGRHVVLDRLTGDDTNYEMEPGEHRLREARLIVDRNTVKSFHQDALCGETGVGVVALPGKEEQRREEPAESVAPHEEPDLVPLLEMEDPQCRLVQLVRLHLDELVSGKGLQDGEQVLAVVAVGWEARTLDHHRDFAAEQRDTPRVSVVDDRRVQTEESPFPDHLAVRPEPLNTHVVEIGGTVDGGHRVRLGQVERVRLPRQPTDLGRGLGEALRDRLPGLLAQYPQPRSGNRDEGVLTVFADKVV